MASQADSAASTPVDFEALLGGDEPDIEEVDNGPADPELEAEADTSEDVEAEPEEESEEEAEEKEAEPSHTVKVNGEAKQVSTSELIAGYQKGADYTAKTQKLAEERRAHEAEVSATQTERARYAQVLAGLETRLKALNPEPDWERLRATDPVAFSVQWVDHQRRQAEIDGVAAEQRRVEDLNAVDHEQRVATYAQAEQVRLLEALPKWKDPKVAQVERRALVDYGVSAGFTPEELSEVMDHRSVVVLHKAMQYDAIKARQGTIRKQVAEAQEPVPVVASTRRNPTTKSVALRNQLSKTGSVRDAAALFAEML